jgi:hypothetical protein
MSELRTFILRFDTDRGWWVYAYPLATPTVRDEVEVVERGGSGGYSEEQVEAGARAAREAWLAVSRPTTPTPWEQAREAARDYWRARARAVLGATQGKNTAREPEHPDIGDEA